MTFPKKALINRPFALESLTMSITLSPTVILIGANAILIIATLYLSYRLSGLLKGRGARTLEDTLKTGFSKITELEDENSTLKDRVDTLDKKMKEAVRNVETLRFNPFEDAGSNQSFASSFVNEEGNGVIVSSLYARGQMSIFAKPVEHFSSKHELTGEEKTVLQKSREKSSR